MKIIIKLKQIYLWLRFGIITSKVKDMAGDHVVAEIEYYDENGVTIGYWAYGYFDPSLPYQGGGFER